MSKVAPLVNDFSGGEFGPLASARVDLERYKKSLETCLNLVPVFQGGLIRRPASKFCKEVKTSSKKTRLERFVFSRSQAYVLEFGDLYIRFFRSNANITSGGSPVEVVTTYTESQVFDLQFFQSNDVLYILHPSLPPKKLIRYSDTSWKLVTIDFYDGPYYGSNREASSSHPTARAITPSAATGNITLTSAVGALGGIANITNNGGLIQVQMAAAPTYLKVGDKINITGVTGTVEANGDWYVEALVTDDYIFTLRGSVYANAYTGGGTVVPAIFASTDVGRFIRLKNYADGKWGYAKITAYTDSTLVNALVIETLTSNAAKYEFRFGVYSDTTGYPVSGCFHEDRMFLFGPGQFVAGSATGDYENFATTDQAGTTVASDSVTFNLNSNDYNNAKWIVSDEKGLLAGTEANEWLIKSASTSEAISPTSINAKKVTSFGSKNIAPVQAGKAVIFPQSAGRKAREFNYFYDVDGFRCTDLTQLADHALQSGVKQMAIQKQPHSIVWIVRTDGIMAGITYEREIDGLKAAWHRHQIGGTSDVAGTRALIESVAVIPSSAGDYDEVWLVVNRRINGATVRYIEYFTKFFDAEVEQEDMFFVDCGLTYDSPLTVTGATAANPVVITSAAHGLANGDKVRFDEVLGMTNLNGNVYKIANKTANTFELTTFDGTNIDGTAFSAYMSGGECRKLVTTVSGLSHLEGQTVQALGDGADLGDLVVSSGAITLPEASAVVQVGLGYNSDGKLPRLEAGSREGTSLGKIRRTHKVGFIFDRSLGFKFGESFDDMKPIIFNDANTILNEAPPLFTGVKVEEFQASSDYDNKICFRQDRPFNCTLLAVMPQMVEQDG